MLPLLENVTVSGAFPDVGVPPATATGGPLRIAAGPAQATHQAGVDRDVDHVAVDGIDGEVHGAVGVGAEVGDRQELVRGPERRDLDPVLTVVGEEVRALVLRGVARARRTRLRSRSCRPIPEECWRSDRRGSRTPPAASCRPGCPAFPSSRTRCAPAVRPARSCPACRGPRSTANRSSRRRCAGRSCSSQVAPAHVADHQRARIAGRGIGAAGARADAEPERIAQSVRPDTRAHRRAGCRPSRDCSGSRDRRRD